jgi:hypothetical protein
MARLREIQGKRQEKLNENPPQALLLPQVPKSQDESSSDCLSDDEPESPEVVHYIQTEFKRIRKMKSITQEVDQIISMELIDPSSGIPGKLTRKRMNSQKIAQLEREFLKK